MMVSVGVCALWRFAPPPAPPIAWSGRPDRRMALQRRQHSRPPQCHQSFDEGELRGPVDGDEQVEFALRGLDLGAFDELALETIGQRIPWVATLGSTEAGFMAAHCHTDAASAGVVGLPPWRSHVRSATCLAQQYPQPLRRAIHILTLSRASHVSRPRGAPANANAQ